MKIRRCARVFYAALALPLAAFNTGCVPGDLLGTGGDNGSSHYTPNYAAAAPAHSQDLPCKDSDSTHLCVALNYVVYQNPSGTSILTKPQAQKNVDGLNSVWSQCHVQFYLENFTSADPKTYALSYAPSTSDELSSVRSVFADKSRLSVVTTGQWTGDLGSQPANAWTELPPVGPFGTVLEASVAGIPNLIAHELGHYLNLSHVSDPYNVMNPVVYGNSINITDSQCGEARATAVTFWTAMLR